MSDFIIIFDPRADTATVERSLQSRPGMSDLSAQSWRFPWGTVTLQPPRSPGYAPYEENGELFFAVGRPRVMARRHEDDGPSGFMQHIHPMFDAQQPGPLYETLTGMFVLVGCGLSGVTLFTDRMGVYAVYDALSPKQSKRVIGTMPEIVAESAERGADYDSVSLAELLIHEVPTFPFTTRRGMRELEPGSCHQFRATGELPSSQHQQSVLWRPVEPERWPSYRESRGQLVDALRFAGQDITRGSKRVGITLSGGSDSRTVLSLVPPPKRSVAITYGDHLNNEVRVAGAIAKAVGIPHHFAVRSPEFYVDLAERETRLIGIERGFVNAHGFALSDCPAPTTFDLLLCGHTSDTLLKGSYYRSLKQPTLFMWRQGGRADSVPFFYRRPFTQERLAALRPEIAEEVEFRIMQRVESIQAWRPTTASEWYEFYPFSRRASIGYTLANARLFPSDQLFLHSRVIEVARVSRPEYKIGGALTRPVFGMINGGLAEIENANTGLPLNAGRIARARRRAARHPFVRKLRRRLYGARQTASAGPTPWSTGGSWVDYGALQRHSSRWVALRRHAAVEGHQFAAILTDDARSALTGFRKAYGSGMNYTYVRLLTHMIAVRARREAVRQA